MLSNIPSFRHGWPNLKSICTPSPKLDSLIPEAVTYKQQSTCTVCQVKMYFFTCFCLYFFSSLLILLHMFRLHFSHLGCAQSMEAWCLNWWLVERFAVSSKSWFQNLRPHSSKLKRKESDLESCYSVFSLSRIISFIRSQNLISFLWIHKSSDCWQVSWIKYGILDILILLHVNSSRHKYFLELWIWIWK